VLGRIVARLARYVRRSEVRNLTDSQREALQIKMAGPSAPISSLSGGGQQKVILGRWMVERLKLLVLDEPTRGIDVMTKAQFHEIIRQLAEEGLAVVVISSDLPEVFAVADRILVMRRGRIVAEFANDGTAPPEEVLRQAVALDQADAGARGASANGNGTIVDVGGVSVLVPSGDPEEKEVTGQ
jgi:ABC-type sugar transport system ATPase subunit